MHGKTPKMVGKIWKVEKAQEGWGDSEGWEDMGSWEDSRKLMGLEGLGRLRKVEKATKTPPKEFP